MNRHALTAFFSIAALVAILLPSWAWQKERARVRQLTQELRNEQYVGQMSLQQAETTRRQTARIAQQYTRGTDESRIDPYFSPRAGCTEAVIEVVEEASQSIYFQAYVVSCSRIAQALSAEHERGVRVEVVLDPMNERHERSVAGFLQARGMAVFVDDRHGAARSNVVIADEETVITGSFDFTPEAEEENLENLLVIRNSPVVAARYTESFLDHREHSRPFRLAEYEAE